MSDSASSVSPEGRQSDSLRSAADDGGRGEGTEETRNLDALTRNAFAYFLEETDPATGLIADRAPASGPNPNETNPASIAAVGFALCAMPVGVSRGFVTHEDARERTLRVLRFFERSKQGPEREATGYKGFYYHFLDMASGRRFGKCELSTVDTAFLIAGMLTASEFFSTDHKDESEIRELAAKLSERVDWRWAANGGATLTHGWLPESGFLRYRWLGYDEALLMYLLALGSPSHPLGGESYAAWCSGYRWKKMYGYEFLFGGPLFLHQYSHAWVDFRGIQDGYMRDRSLDYFENSRRATYIQREYAIRNPRGLCGYGKDFWGITASDGPGQRSGKGEHAARKFFAYKARGVPYGPDDGTVAPWAVAASLPFAPDIVLPALKHFQTFHPQCTGRYSLISSINLNCEDESEKYPGWASCYHYGINLGPLVVMLENHRSDLVWSLMRKNKQLRDGLRAASFSGGWLEA